MSDISLQKSESGMTSAELQAKYDTESWGSHPQFTFSDWQEEVAEGNTRRGYWDWVAAKIEYVAFSGGDSIEFILPANELASPPQN